MNLVVLGGRLVKDCELTKTAKGLAIAKFAVAVNDYEASTTSFINCTAFGKTAATIDKWFHKGDVIVLNGKISQNKYENKEGKKISSFEIIVNTFMFANAKKDTREISDEPCKYPSDEPCKYPSDEPCEEPSDEPCEELTDEDLPF